jgi:RimJ/RimL family protein N-acetyltransferase
MPRSKQLLGEHCYLSPPLPEDADDWAAWLADLRVALPLGDEAYTQTNADEQRQFIREPGAGCRLFTIVLAADDRPIGRGILFNLDFVNRTGHLGLFIGDPACWGQGLGREAVTLLLDYAFSLLNLNSVMLGAFEFNERALACYRAVGFREIGRRRAARTIAGHTYDAILMDLLASEFQSPYVAALLREGD